jgi:hypothetical protein
MVYAKDHLAGIVGLARVRVSAFQLTMKKTELPMPLEKWLARGKKDKKPRKPMKPRSKKRAKADAEYSVRRKRFLAEHPYCQWWLRENGCTEEQADLFQGWVWINQYNTMVKVQVPLSNQIHHMRKPKSKYLNDESTWMAVSREGHEWIENNKSEARKRGYLFDI